MQTAKIRATEFLQSLEVMYCDVDADNLENILKQHEAECRADQHELTRHACAERVSGIPQDMTASDLIDTAHQIIMNTKAV